MQEDTLMEDGYETDYPEPTTQYRTPYPAIQRDGVNHHQKLLQSADEGNNDDDEMAGDDEDVDSTNPMPVPTIPRTVPAYTSLAEYFRLGTAGHTTDPALATQNRPWTDRFFNSYAGSSYDETSLPGHHVLHEIDRLEGTHRKGPQSQQWPTLSGADGPAYSSRGRGAARGRTADKPRGSQRGGRKGRGGWKQALKGTDHADLFKTPRLRREPGARKPGRQPGAAPKQVDPGEEFKELQQSGMHAYMDGEYEQALEHFLQAVRVNPEVYQAYSMISQIKRKQGLDRDAVHVMASGAVIRKDPQIWTDLARDYLALDDGARNEVDIHSAVYCYKQAAKRDQNNYEARDQLAELSIAIGEFNEARNWCKKALRVRPCEIRSVRRYASLCDMRESNDDWDAAIHAYEEAFRLHADQDTFGDSEEQWDHLNVYLDLVRKVQKPKKGIRELKRIARWFLGRKNDTFWDEIELDDREYDSTHDLRAQVLQFQQGRVSRNNLQYGDGLPLDLRVKFGLFRLQMGSFHQSEALKHLEHLRRLSNEIENFADMFFDVAEALRTSGMLSAAINFFEPIKPSLELVNVEKFWMGLGYCYDALGRKKDAEECYLQAIEEAEDNIDTRLALVRLYQATGQPVKAFAVASEISRLGRDDILKRERIRLKSLNPNHPDGTPKSKTPRKKHTQTKALLREEGAFPGDVSIEMPTRPRSKSQLRKAGPNIAKKSMRMDSADSLATDTVPGDRNPHEDNGNIAGLRTARKENPVSFLLEQKVRVQADYSKVKELWPTLEGSDPKDVAQLWAQYASAMAIEFQAMKEFFPSRTRDKYFTGLQTGAKVGGRTLISEMEAIKKQLNGNVSSGQDAEALRQIDDGSQWEFHGISFDEWHRVISNLALLYARSVEQDKCYDMLGNVLMQANVFRHNPGTMETTLALCICCALMFNDSQFVSETVQRYDLPGSHGPAIATQLVAASGRLGHGENYFNNRNTQRWTQLKLTEQDYLSMYPEQRMNADWGKDASRLEELSKHAGDGVADLDAGLLTIYGHINAHRQGNSETALMYLFRALALEPENLVVNLSIATTYISKGMRRMSEHRQYDIAQGQAFLYRYYDLRVASGKTCHLQEAKYNLARMWHMLGMNHLAVPAYEKVLKLSSQVQQETQYGSTEGGQVVDDLAPEAAFALRRLFMQSGNEQAARAITEEWLVL